MSEVNPNISRVFPVTGPERQRQWLKLYGGQHGSLPIEDGEIHTTSQARMFMKHEHIGGWAFHDDVATAAMLQTLWKGPRGCWPGDIAFVMATQRMMLCKSGNGTLADDWAELAVGSGDKGDPGDKGWSPSIIYETDGERRVARVIDWIGGAGTKPASGFYVGLGGPVFTKADAVDFRGEKGDAGADSTGGHWVKILDDPLSSLTNLTPITGSWTLSDGTVYLPPHSHVWSMARWKTWTPRVRMVEVEVMIPTGHSYGGAAGGVVINWHGTDDWSGDNVIVRIIQSQAAGPIDTITIGNATESFSRGGFDLPTGVWHKLTVQFNDGEVTAFVDGSNQYATRCVLTSLNSGVKEYVGPTGRQGVYLRNFKAFAQAIPGEIEHLGEIGLNAWTPVLAAVDSGERTVIQVLDWMGGSGDKPEAGYYLGSTGYVPSPADATNVKGSSAGGGSSSGPSVRDGLKWWITSDATGLPVDQHAGRAWTRVGSPARIDGKLEADAMLFAASPTDRITSPILDDYTQPLGFSFCGWVKRISGTYGYILGTTSYNESVRSLYVFQDGAGSTAEIALYTSSGGARSANLNSIPWNSSNWEFMCISYDRVRGLLIGRNGNGTWHTLSTLTSELGGQVAPDIHLLTSGLFQIGNLTNSSGDASSTAIDSIACWDRPLSAAEMVFLYNSGAGRKYSETV